MFSSCPGYPPPEQKLTSEIFSSGKSVDAEEIEFDIISSLTKERRRRRVRERRHFNNIPFKPSDEKRGDYHENLNLCLADLRNFIVYKMGM